MKIPIVTNPRQLRTLSALLRRPLRREELDQVAGCSNGPDLVAGLRRLGLEVLCERVKAWDRDGRPCRPGVYHLTPKARRKVWEMLSRGADAAAPLEDAEDLFRDDTINPDNVGGAK